MSHICILRPRKKVLKIFREFISQERDIRILIWSAHWLYFYLLLKWQLGLKSNYRNYEFSRKNTEIVIYIFHLNSDDEICLQKAEKLSDFESRQLGG